MFALLWTVVIDFLRLNVNITPTALLLTCVSVWDNIAKSVEDEDRETLSQFIGKASEVINEKKDLND